MNGVKQTLTARSKYPNTISDLKVNEVQELRFDGDYVVAVKDIDPIKFVTNYATDWDDHEVYYVNYTGETLELKGRTFQSKGTNDQGWTIASTSMPTVLRHKVNGKTETINYSSMSEALAAVGDANTNVAGLQFDGRIVTVMNSQGVAQWAFIESDIEVKTGSGSVPGGGSGKNFTYDATIFSNGMARVSVTAARPEYVVHTHTANGVSWTGAVLNYSYDVLVNGQLYATVDSSVTGEGIAANATTATSLWSNWSAGWGVPLDSNDTITVENFRFTNLSVQNYYLKVVDQNGNDLSNVLTLPSASAYWVAASGTGTNRTFDFIDALYQSGTFQVTGIKGGTTSVTLPTVATNWNGSTAFNIRLTAMTLSL